MREKYPQHILWTTFFSVMQLGPGYPWMNPGFGYPEMQLVPGYPGIQPGECAAPRRVRATSCRPAYLRAGAAPPHGAVRGCVRPEMTPLRDLTLTGLLRVRRSLWLSDANGFPHARPRGRRDPDCVGGRLSALCPALHPGLHPGRNSADYAVCWIIPAEKYCHKYRCP